MEEVKIRFECGRFVTAAMGYYVMQVIDIKKNHGQWFTIAHGGTHHFRTPAAQDHDHPFFVLTQAELLINMRPRKALDYLSPYEYLTDKRVSFIAEI